MTAKLSDLSEGVYRVTCEGATFLVSVQRDSFGCLPGIKAFHEGDPRPKRSQHLLATEFVTDWISRFSKLEMLSGDHSLRDQISRKYL